jgi:hypothetical protein
MPTQRRCHSIPREDPQSTVGPVGTDDEEAVSMDKCEDVSDHLLAGIMGSGGGILFFVFLLQRNQLLVLCGW